MLLATSLLALTLAAGPAKPCAAPAQTGIFRITAVSHDGTSAKIGMLLLESVENCLEASIITEDAGPALLDNLEVKDDVITGRVRLPNGNATVTLRFSNNAVEGSIDSGKRAWSLSGKRTSGADAHAMGEKD